MRDVLSQLKVVLEKGLSPLSSTFHVTLGLLVVALCAPALVNAAEYKDAENTAPRSAIEIEHTLADVAGTILLTRGPVIEAIDTWRKKRGPFFRDGHVNFNFRTMNFDTELVDVFETQTWAAPGEIAYRSGQWKEFLTIGASVYGSYEMSGDDFSGLSGMLQVNGDNITTLGQAYLELDWRGLTGRAYRQTLDIPYLNRNDSRMIPNTFEAYGVSGDNKNLDFILGYVDKVKLRNREDFITMGEAAGVDGGNSGTNLAGILWKPADTGFNLGVTIQQTSDVFRLLYTEAEWKRKYDKWDVRLSAQYTSQKSVGDDFIGSFSTNALGLKTSAGYRDAVFSVAYTETDDDAQIKSPFGGKPGYTSSMVRDFDRANEKAWRVGASYHFNSIGLPAWSMNINYTSGEGGFNDGSLIPLEDNHELDVTLDYKPDSGRFAGLWLRARYAKVRETGIGDVANQFRFIVNFSLAAL